MKYQLKFNVLLVLLLCGAGLMAQDKQKKSKTFQVSRVIEAPAAKVWSVVGEDFGAIANSHPKIIKSSYLEGSLAGGEGSERVCYFNEEGSKYVKEKQVNYDSGNMTFKAQVYHAGGLPLDPEYNWAVYSVEKIDDNTSKLVIDMGLRTKPAFMGALFKGKFKKTIEDYAIAVEHHVLTGENVNKENFKEIKGKYK